jgi:hypothetical protein
LYHKEKPVSMAREIYYEATPERRILEIVNNDIHPLNLV